MGGEWGDTEADAGSNAIAQAVRTVPGQDPLAVKEEMREALAKGEFVLAYQPTQGKLLNYVQRVPLGVVAQITVRPLPDEG